MESGSADQEEKKLCSNCKREIGISTFELHEAHCRRHIRLCEECQEPVPIQNMEEHFAENHAPTSCDLCGVTMPKDKLEEHKESQCPKRTVECKYCELDIKAAEYDDHIEACGSRTDFCDKCNLRVMLRDMEEHKLVRCGDLKAEDFPNEPTLENLPPGYMDAYRTDAPGGNFQGPLIGNGEFYYPGQDEGEFDVHGGFGAGYFGYPMGGNTNGSGGGEVMGERERREDGDAVQVDPQWLEEVGGVCEGEDIDRMVAQAIAMEDNKHATARDHMYGIDDRVLREGEYANTVRELEGQRAERDADMARRLQQEYDREYYREQADEELAKQLDKENNPNGAHPPSTSPPPDYGLLEREREREREMEMERERAMESEMEREREREMERERERAMERERERERERQRQREEDSLMAERLQQEESRRLQRQIERRERKERQGPEDRGGEETMVLKDTRLALQLQEEELQSAREKIREEREKIEAERERIQEFRREIGLDQGEEREKEGAEEAIQRDSRFLSRSSGFRPSSPPLPAQYGSTSSPPLPAQYGANPFPENYVSEPPDDSEQPRLKPIPRPHPLKEGEDEIPCQFCNKLFKFDTIMSHQQHCNADYQFPPGQRRVTVQDAPKIDLDEMLREDEDREHTSGGNEFPCQFCHEPYPQSCILAHQAVCDKNPDKHLKNVYQTRAAMRTRPAVTMTTTRPQAVSTAANTGSDMIPCQFCEQLVPFADVIRHETVCRFQRIHPPKPPSLPPSSQPTHTHPHSSSSTRSPLPTHTLQHPSTSPQPNVSKTTEHRAATSPHPAPSSEPTPRVSTTQATHIPSATMATHTHYSTAGLRNSGNVHSSAVHPLPPTFPSFSSSSSSSSSSDPFHLEQTHPATDEQKIAFGRPVAPSVPSTAAALSSPVSHPPSHPPQPCRPLRGAETQADRSAHNQAPPTAHGQAPPTAHGQAPPTAHGQAPPTAHGQAPPTAHGQAPPTTHSQAPPTATHLFQLPHIYTSASLPHTVDRVGGHKRGTADTQFSPPIDSDTKVPKFGPPASDLGRTNQPPVLHQVHAATTYSPQQPAEPVTMVTASPSITRDYGRSSLPGQLPGPSPFITASGPTRPTGPAFHVNVTPTPISLLSSNDVVAHTLKMGSVGHAFQPVTSVPHLTNHTPTILRPIAPPQTKDRKTAQDTVQYNVHIQPENTKDLPGKGTIVVPQDVMVQKPLAALDMTVVGRQPLLITSNTLVDAPKVNKPVIGKYMKEGEKGVLDILKIEQSQNPPFNNSSYPSSKSASSINFRGLPPVTSRGIAPLSRADSESSESGDSDNDTPLTSSTGPLVEYNPTEHSQIEPTNGSLATSTEQPHPRGSGHTASKGGKSPVRTSRHTEANGLTSRMESLSVQDNPPHPPSGGNKPLAKKTTTRSQRPRSPAQVGQGSQQHMQRRAGSPHSTGKVQARPQQDSAGQQPQKTRSPSQSKTGGKKNLEKQIGIVQGQAVGRGKGSKDSRSPSSSVANRSIPQVQGGSSPSYSKSGGRGGGRGGGEGNRGSTVGSSRPRPAGSQRGQSDGGQRPPATGNRGKK